MRKLLAIVTTLGLIALVIYIYASSQTIEQTYTFPELPAAAVPATVDYVHDGDTLFLTDGTKVRLLAIDTPELGDCYGDEARDYLRQLLPEGTQIYTEMDVEATDQYGRSLFFIYTEDTTMVNLQLAEQGYAEAVFIGANRLHEAEVEAAEDAAQEAGRGMWGNC